MAVFDTGGSNCPDYPDKNQTTKIRLVPKGIGLFFFHEYGRKFVILQLEMDMKYPIGLELKLL
jgi:hypothetical protein